MPGTGTDQQDITMTVRAEYDARGWAQLGEAFATAFQAFVEEYGRLGQSYAQKNVLPDAGPGPHPHRGTKDGYARKSDSSRHGFVHKDTSKLLHSIQYEVERKGYKSTVSVFSDLDYATFLEIGWSSVIPTKIRRNNSEDLDTLLRGAYAELVSGTISTGRFYRYPFLAPAFAELNAEIDSLARKFMNLGEQGILRPQLQATVTKTRPKGSNARFEKGIFSQNITGDIESARQTDVMNRMFWWVPTYAQQIGNPRRLPKFPTPTPFARYIETEVGEAGSFGGKARRVRPHPLSEVRNVDSHGRQRGKTFFERPNFKPARKKP